MPYFTFPAPVRYPQITIDDLLSMDLNSDRDYGPIGKVGDTRTYFQTTVPNKMKDVSLKGARVYALASFCRKYENLYRVPRHSLYHSFSIHKRNGKLRQIDAPLEPLMVALRELKTIFETQFNASHHTSAFAYAQGRAAVSAVQRHQRNDSRWFLKLDCSNFFGSTTKDFVLRMLSLIWPFSEIMEDSSTRPFLERAIDLAFLDGVLPQGTPLSPIVRCKMKPQYIPNGTLVVFNRDHSWSSHYGEAMCEVLDLRDDSGGGSVYLLRFCDGVPEDIAKERCSRGMREFRCHVYYFELAEDLEIDPISVSELL